jgi:predicted lysophospholipase L1 biosynthesis ABC-type transport system permease subunit
MKLFYFVLPSKTTIETVDISASVLSTTLSILMIFSIIIFLLVSLIYNKNRNKTFGIMRGVGARKGFIFTLLFMENLIILVVSGLTGLVISSIFFNPGADYLIKLYSVTSPPGWDNFLFSILITLGAVFLLSAFSALITSLRIIFIDPYEILRSRE